MAKLNLKAGKPEGETGKVKSMFVNNSLLFFSGFALTDNHHFAEFFLPELPQGVDEEQIRTFNFSEEMLEYLIGGQPKIVLDNENNVVHFDSYTIEKKYFLYFTDKYPNANFFWLKSFLHEPIIGLIGVLIGTKLVGLLKLKTERIN